MAQGAEVLFTQPRNDAEFFFLFWAPLKAVSHLCHSGNVSKQYFQVNIVPSENKEKR